MENINATPMTDQDFYEFQTTVDGTACSYENQANGTTIISCEDGTQLLVTPDGDSKPLKPPRAAMMHGETK
jgi:hypothetical protein